MKANEADKITTQKDRCGHIKLMAFELSDRVFGTEEIILRNEPLETSFFF